MKGSVDDLYIRAASAISRVLVVGTDARTSLGSVVAIYQNFSLFFIHGFVQAGLGAGGQR